MSNDGMKVDEDWKRRAQEEKEKLAQKLSASGPPKIEVPPGVARERPRETPAPAPRESRPAEGAGKGSGPATQGGPVRGPAGKPQPPVEEPEEADLPAGDEGHRGLPEANFKTFVASLAAQALMSLGQIEHPETGQRYLDLDQARYTIDTLAMLREKTRGNLAADETQHMESILSELQMIFVRMANRVGSRT